MHQARRCLTEEHCSCDAYACLLINHVSILGRNMVRHISGDDTPPLWESRQASIRRKFSRSRHRARLSAPCCFVRPDGCGGVSSLRLSSGPSEYMVRISRHCQAPTPTLKQDCRAGFAKRSSLARAQPVPRSEQSRDLASGGQEKESTRCSASSPTRKFPAACLLVFKRAQSPECYHQRAASGELS